MLKREAENPPNVDSKVWIYDIRSKIKNADLAVLFGSVLKKGKEANDVDILFVTDQERLNNLKKEIEDLQLISKKKMHPMFQNEQDIKDNIKRLDRPLLSAIKGIVVLGEEKIIEVLAG